jgi:hypothetical protein
MEEEEKSRSAPDYDDDIRCCSMTRCSRRPSSIAEKRLADHQVNVDLTVDITLTNGCHVDLNNKCYLTADSP